MAFLVSKLSLILSPYVAENYQERCATFYHYIKLITQYFCNLSISISITHSQGRTTLPLSFDYKQPTLSSLTFSLSLIFSPYVTENYQERCATFYHYLKLIIRYFCNLSISISITHSQGRTTLSLSFDYKQCTITPLTTSQSPKSTTQPTRKNPQNPRQSESHPFTFF